MEGNCDFSSLSIYKGWIFDRSRPHLRIEIEVLLDGRPIKTVVAEQYREDLLKSGVGDGCHAYNFAVPLEAACGLQSPVSFALREKSTGEIIANSVRSIDLRTEEMDFLQLRQFDDDLVDLRLDHGLQRARNVTVAIKGESRPSQKVALFAVNARGLLASHRKIMSELKEAGYFLIAINSDDRFGHGWLEYAENLADIIVIKQDEGRDISSWLTAFHLFRKDLEAAEHVLFVNESLCGPLRPIAPVLSKGIAAGVDFWALSDSYDTRYHLQSSFFILTARAVSSRSFREFVASYSYPDDKKEVIKQGEVGLSACLLSGGMSSDVLCRYEDLCDAWMSHYQGNLDEVSNLSCFLTADAAYDVDQRKWLNNGLIEHWVRWVQHVASAILSGQPLNPQHVFWRLMIEKFDYPFVKRELLTANPAGIPDLSALASIISQDDWELLKADLRQTAGRAPPLRKMPLRGSNSDAI